MNNNRSQTRIYRKNASNQHYGFLKIGALLIFILGICDMSMLQACCFSYCETEKTIPSSKASAPPREIMPFTPAPTRKEKVRRKSTRVFSSLASSRDNIIALESLYAPGERSDTSSSERKVEKLSSQVQILTDEGTLIKAHITPYQAPNPFAPWRKPPHHFTGTTGQVHSIDTRRKIPNASRCEVPWIVHGYISIKFKDGNMYRGSGTLVNKHHVLTAGHVIFNHNKKLGNAIEMSFEVLIDGKREKILATSWRTTQEWKDNADSNADLGMIFLQEDLGLRTGWNGLMSAPKSGLINHTVNVTGHPGDLDEEGKDLFTATGTIQNIKKETFTYDIDTAPGNSGSGVWGQWETLNGYFCVGVHTQFLASQHRNQATRLSKKRFDEVVSWIENH